jgi:hypothetical protein
MGMFTAFLEFYRRDTKARNHFGNVDAVVVLAFFVSTVEKMLILNQVPDLYMRKCKCVSFFVQDDDD